MSGEHHGENPFKEVLEEISLAAFIVVAHAALVLVIIGAIYVTGMALEATKHGDHEATLGGVSARFLIEGGEITLVGVVLVLGIVSAFVTLLIGLVRRVRGS